MANSKYEYVRSFEQADQLLPNTWIVVRVDGRAFHSFSNRYGFAKPNDHRALDLMNAAAYAVLKDLSDIRIAYGVSDEYSFVFRKDTILFERRSSKLLSTVLSTFTAFYIHLWPTYFPNTPLQPPHLPTFDARTITYPTAGNLRDYLSWRQVDCHINNLYNTTFWSMRLKGNLGARDVEEELKGTVASDKNEILWSRYGINYNDEPDMFKKGSMVFREYELEDGRAEEKTDEEEGDSTALRAGTEPSKTQKEKEKKARNRAKIVIKHVDIIRDGFWDQRPWILGSKPGKPVAIAV